jgi:hypothetical protein
MTIHEIGNAIVGDIRSTIIEEYKKQLADRDAQIAALRNGLRYSLQYLPTTKNRLLKSLTGVDSFTSNDALELIENTQAAAETHNTKVRDAAILEFKERLEEQGFDVSDKFTEALLSKEPT